MIKVKRILFFMKNDEKSQVLKTVLLEEFVKPNEPILKFLSNRDNKFLKTVKIAYKWFEDTLQIITPDSKPRALAHKIDVDKEFKNYAKDLMGSFNIGITELVSEKKDIKEFFGEDNEKELDNLIKDVEDSPKKMIGLRSNKGEELIIVKEDGKIWVKTLKVGHIGKRDKSVLFGLDEESDGTVRLLDFVPAFKSVISNEKVFIIDEIERSIHPLLIKELVQKFSLDPDSKGQLIFSTHESNLLDQEIFRQDEIWFAEKNKDGSTDLYSLNDFKEHKTIDIQRGYLNGRYGSIPFLGNLQDLNWHNYDTN
jgi:AAA15 family ATPase/GTPase